MELAHEFTVNAPIDRAWAVLTDIERIAPCMPGAELTEVDGDTYHGLVKVKVGPITAQYKGTASFVEKDEAASFSRATNDALTLLTRAGFDVREAFWVATYLLHGAIGLVAGQPDCPTAVPADQVAEWRRQKRLKMERLPADQFPMIVAFAGTYNDEPDPERYFTFGIDLLMAGVSAVAQSIRA